MYVVFVLLPTAKPCRKLKVHQTAIYLVDF